MGRHSSTALAPRPLTDLLDHATIVRRSPTEATVLEDQSLPLHPKHTAWLEEMVETYDLADVPKALRILIEYAIQQGDLDTIFTEVRCTKC